MFIKNINEIDRQAWLKRIHTIPAPDSTLDAILCSEVLEHVPEPTHAIDEFARLLKPGGVMILTHRSPPTSTWRPMTTAAAFPSIGMNTIWHNAPFTSNRLSPMATGTPLLRQEITRLGGLERQ